MNYSNHSSQLTGQVTGTETALLRVHHDIVNAFDQKKGVFLVLPDLSAAFGTVDHDILLDFLRDHIGLGRFCLGFI